MMQDYDFSPALRVKSTNTSTKSVSICRPSQRVIQNIRTYARCIQHVNMGDVKIKLHLN
ncbi:MAG: hypothetical protein MJZ81_03750 [Bacteroidales bacterium]|nr:hypothetical protein [Bacteroidales bacterium]